jgi:hypothetical protein
MVGARLKSTALDFAQQCLITSRMHGRVDRHFLAVCLALMGGCAPSVNAPGYPLYPSSATPPPPDEVARLYGPITSVDGRDVSALGGAFELLPGCHTVVTEGQPLDSTTYTAVSGRRPPGKYFVLPMRPGHSYYIKQVSSADVSTISPIRVTIFAEEFDHGGASQKVFYPAKPGAAADCQGSDEP